MNFKRVLGIALLGLACLVMSGKADAASGVRGAKASTTLYGTTNVVGISSGAAVVYSVVLGTGTAGTDFVVLFDSGSASGLAVGSQATASGYKLRVNVSSATQPTLVSFDPPLQFINGVMVANSAGTITAVVTWEKGRIGQGY